MMSEIARYPERSDVDENRIWEYYIVGEELQEAKQDE